MRYRNFLTRGIFILLLFIHQLIFSQSSNEQLIPNVTPPAPESAQLGRFGNYPISHFTGLVNIDIPIHEVVVKDIRVPIVIKYHPSGIKVTDRAGLVGLGWALQAGGTITRQVMSKPDENPEGYLNSTTIASSIDTYSESGLLYLNEVNRGIKDTEPDIYSYSIGSMSGKFLFNQGDNYAKVMIPYNPVKFNYTVNDWDLKFDAFDQYGINYKFDTIFEASSNFNENFATRSAWKISEIISRTKQDTIKFTYTQTSGNTYSDVSDIITVDDLVDNKVPGTFSSHLGLESQSLQSIYSTEQVLSQIDYPLGKVEFTLATGREDGYSEQNRLDAVKVYRIDPETGSYMLSKTVQFYQHYFESTNDKRLRLDSLQVRDEMGIVVQRYRFAYNMEKSLPDYNSKERDYWGYFNNKNNNTLVPRQTIAWQSSVTTSQTTITIGSNITDGRDPDSTYMKAWVLEKIMYPTGGWTEFEYETNKYLDANQNSKYAGGLRIAKIRSYEDGYTNPLVKTIKYGENESGFGRANFILNNYSYQSEVTERYLHPAPSCGESTKRKRTFIATPSINIEPYDGSPVVYSQVTVYEGDESSNIGKTIYNYSDYTDNLSSSYSIGVPAIESKHFKRGQLLKKSVYKIDGSTETLVQETSNTYGAFSDSTKSSIGLKVKKNIINLDNTAYDYFTGMPDACHPGDVDSYQYTYYRIITGDSKLKSTQVLTYESDGTFNTGQSTTYSFDNYLHQQVTKTITSTSKNQILESITEYPHESTPSGQVYSEMVQKHMIAYPVKEETKLSGTTISTVKRNYINPYANVYEPDAITRKYGSGAEYTEASFSKYDGRGNVLEFTSRSGITKSIIWGYDGQFPVAEITGNDYSEVEVALGGSITLDQNGMNLSSTQISQLRQSLPDAQIATYIFDPGRGLTSTSDPNDIKSYYSYDNFGRLSYVQDYNSNIVAAYDYKYKPQKILTTSAESLSFNSSTQSSNINIITDKSWNVSDDQLWISVSPTSGTGNGTVSVTVQSNSGSSSRTGIVSIVEANGSGFFDRDIPIDQDGYTPTLQVSTTSLTFPGVTTKTFTITSDISWTISLYYYDGNGWLNVSPVSGSGNATISVSSTSAGPTGGQPPWEADIQVSGSGIYRIIDCTKYY